MELIIKYFPELNKNQIEKLILIKFLYYYWNNKINLISRKNIDNFYEQHVLHSLSIAKIIKFVDNTYIMDLGTGGGFPGIPLSILFNNTKFLLVDSILKKIKILNIIKHEMLLKNVKILYERAEKINDKFDFILSRGVTNIPQLYFWVQKKFKLYSKNTLKNGCLFLKGGNINHELRKIPNSKEYNLTHYFNEYFFQTKKIIYIPMNN